MPQTPSLTPRPPALRPAPQTGDFRVALDTWARETAQKSQSKDETGRKMKKGPSTVNSLSQANNYESRGEHDSAEILPEMRRTRRASVELLSGPPSGEGDSASRLFTRLMGLSGCFGGCFGGRTPAGSRHQVVPEVTRSESALKGGAGGAPPSGNGTYVPGR